MLFQKHHTMAIVAAGVGVASAGYSAYRSIHGAQQAKNAQRDLENLKTPGYVPNQAIGKYYQNALTRYNTNPYNSSMYQVSKENADKSLGTGIGSLQDRRSALAGVSALTSGYNNSLQKSVAQAEGQRSQNFSQLSRASAMKSADDRTAFQYNQVMPYSKKLSLYNAQAIGGIAQENAGLQDVSSGVNNLAKIYDTYSRNRPPKIPPSAAMQDNGGNQYGTGSGPQTM